MSDRLKKLRKQKGITQIELGEKIGVSQQVVTNYERGLREPNLEMLLKIAGVLDVSLEQLVGVKPMEVEEQTPRSLQRRLEAVKRLPKEKQRAFISFVDALTT